MATGRQTLHLPRARLLFPPQDIPQPEPTEIPLGTYHAKLKGKRPRRGLITMAQDLTDTEIACLGPAPRGPGTDPIIEALATGSANGRILRWRNSGEHPLTQAWETGKITDAHFIAGEILRDLCETLTASTTDSSQKLDRISGGGTHTPWSQRQAEAISELKRIQRRMRKADWIICRKFCGEGYKMVEALRASGISFNKHRVVSRVCMALDYLAGNKRKGARKRRPRKKAPR
jgi:hypothetical protein